MIDQSEKILVGSRTSEIKAVKNQRKIEPYK